MGEIVASPTEKQPFKWTAGWRVLLTLGSFLSAGPFVYFYGTLLWFTSIATETPMPLEFTVLLSLLAIFVVLVLPAALPKVAILPVWLTNVGIFLYLAAEAIPVWQRLNDPASPDFKPDFSAGDLIPPPLLQITISTAVFSLVLWRPMTATIGGWLSRTRRIFRAG